MSTNGKLIKGYSTTFGPGGRYHVFATTDQQDQVRWSLVDTHSLTAGGAYRVLSSSPSLKDCLRVLCK